MALPTRLSRKHTLSFIVQGLLLSIVLESSAMAFSDPTFGLLERDYRDSRSIGLYHFEQDEAWIGKCVELINNCETVFPALFTIRRYRDPQTPNAPLQSKPIIIHFRHNRTDYLETVSREDIERFYVDAWRFQAEFSAPYPFANGSREDFAFTHRYRKLFGQWAGYDATFRRQTETSEPFYVMQSSCPDGVVCPAGVGSGDVYRYCYFYEERLLK